MYVEWCTKCLVGVLTEVIRQEEIFSLKAKHSSLLTESRVRGYLLVSQNLLLLFSHRILIAC